MNEKKQKRTALFGVVLLIGLFALGYMGINRFAFATTANNNNNTTQGLLEDGLDDNVVDYATETDDYVFHHIPLQDHYITAAQAQALFIETLYEETGLEFEVSDFQMILIDDVFLDNISIWDGYLDSNDAIHQIKIDAETGEVLEFITSRMPIEGYYTTTVSVAISDSYEITFDIDDRTAFMPSNFGEIQPFHLSIEEAASIVARVVDEEFDTSLDGHTLIINFNDNPHNDGEYWQGWIILEEDISLTDADFADYDTAGFDGLADYGISFLIDARTGEVINLLRSPFLG